MSPSQNHILNFSTYAPDVCGWERVTENFRSFAALTESKLSTGNFIRRVVCAKATGVITQVHVHDGQEIKKKGELLFDIRLPSGAIMSVVSIDRGYIQLLDKEGRLGQSILLAKSQDSEVGIPIEKGTPIFEMLPNRESASRGTAKALRPTGSRVMWLRNQRLLAA